ncbi:hypothetical protein NUW54_g11102 [Trametes sanguinea]|uniref:Uncharacterized protein n=1 Tax=Trametes sanguinea TaxID=158606 RepID=A0ACC1NMQ7_9APHY|nr:hypothetical protein NUW54_g11102 [Trametes sanguinea]
MLGVPDVFAADLMHLVCLNLTELIMGLLRGSLTCEDPDDRATWVWAVFADREVWQTHGRLVGNATRYLPGSFDRPPRNPAEKISSGYKAWEFLLYVYGLLPGLLRAIRSNEEQQSNHMTTLPMRRQHLKEVIRPEQMMTPSSRGWILFNLMHLPRLLQATIHRICTLQQYCQPERVIAASAHRLDLHHSWALTPLSFGKR